jgi:hypothetical protein
VQYVVLANKQSDKTKRQYDASISSLQCLSDLEMIIIIIFVVVVVVVVVVFPIISRLRYHRCAFRELPNNQSTSKVVQLCVPILATERELREYNFIHRFYGQKYLQCRFVSQQTCSCSRSNPKAIAYMCTFCH